MFLIDLNKKIGFRIVPILIACFLMVGFSTMTTSCKREKMYGPGKFHDITEIRRGMSPNEVRRVLGSNYKLIMKEGLQGADMGVYIWEYPEGRIYFNHNGVFRVEPFKK